MHVERPKNPIEMLCRGRRYQSSHWSIQTDIRFKTSDSSTGPSSQGQRGGAT